MIGMQMVDIVVILLHLALFAVVMIGAQPAWCGNHSPPDVGCEAWSLPLNVERNAR